MKRYKNVQEWRLYIKYETNHTVWTSTMPLTSKIFLCSILVELMRLFGNAALPTSRNISRQASACISFRFCISKKWPSSYDFFSYFLKRYGTNLQNDIKLETTSCFIVEKMALEERSFRSGSLWEAYW